MPFMGGNGSPGMLPAVTAPITDFGFANELTLSNLGTFALTAENCDENRHRSAWATPDDCATWTNEKHGLYLNHLELSFVKQLQQSMSLLVQNSKQYKPDKSISQNQSHNVNHAPEKLAILQNGHCKTSNDERDESFSRTYTDSCDILTTPWIDNYGKIRMQCPSSSADINEFRKLYHTKKRVNGKVIVCCALATCSEQFSASHLNKADSFDLLEEGAGQNFVNEDNSCTCIDKYRMKRLKACVEESSSYDQTTTCRKFLRTHNSDV